MPEKTIHFDSPEAINALLAGDMVGNLKAAESFFGIRIVTRDGWIKLSAADRHAIERACAFFSELRQIRETSIDVRQKDFDLALSAARAEMPADFKELYTERIKVSPRKPDVTPRNAAQLGYIRDMRRCEIVFGVGPAGTGKTYLAMAMAVSSFLAGSFNRIVLTRPAREAGESLGFLPGTLEEKIRPYLRPLYDALYDMIDFEEANHLIESGIIEMAPLAFMRGRTLNNSFIILDEAQNTTAEQMLMFLTRLGFNSKCVITGDPTQTDLPRGRPSGLIDARKALRGIPEIAFKEFTSRDVVRNYLVEKIVSAYERRQKRGRVSTTAHENAE